MNEAQGVGSSWTKKRQPSFRGFGSPSLLLWRRLFIYRSAAFSNDFNDEVRLRMLRSTTVCSSLSLSLSLSLFLSLSLSLSSLRGTHSAFLADFGRKPTKRKKMKQKKKKKKKKRISRKRQVDEATTRGEQTSCWSSSIHRGRDLSDDPTWSFNVNRPNIDNTKKYTQIYSQHETLTCTVLFSSFRMYNNNK